MPDKTFLETFPLYRKHSVQVPKTMDRMTAPRLNFICDICKSEQTFDMKNRYSENEEFSNAQSAGKVIRAFFRCLGCNKSERVFFILVSPRSDYLMKVGQHPAWDIKSDPNVETMLGQHKSFLRKGAVCESQNYGIAAFAYYRRIVEEVIDALLGDVAALMTGEELAAYAAALEDTKRTRVAAEKIALVKDLLPPILRPNGMNPLATLHGTLSEGLHAQSDEDCMANAEIVRETLTFLSAQIALSKSAARSFTDNMQKLLEKRSGARNTTHTDGAPPSEKA